MSKIQRYSVCGCRTLIKIYNILFSKKHFIILSILLVLGIYYFTPICRQDITQQKWAKDGLSRLKQLKQAVSESDPTESDNTKLSVLDKVRNLTKCTDRPMVPVTKQRGEYWVLYNYVPAKRSYKCHESITYTTHADYSFLDNLVPLLERWNGPISVALHAPGSDFNKTMASIAYLRDCMISEVKEFVTFHVYFHRKHLPIVIPKHNRLFRKSYNCTLPPPYLNVNVKKMYKTQKRLLYPVNVGRNIARETAQTHFILPSDIELYPSINIIPRFLAMIGENKGSALAKHPRVFPLPIFEVTATSEVPERKNELLEMLQNETAIPFHHTVCPFCHKIPLSIKWSHQKESEDGRLKVFHPAKRIGAYARWEPIFIGTHADPLYDERLSWEGKSDKMSQGYAFCVLDYNFLILDSAFLVHKPGIKAIEKDKKRDAVVWKTNKKIKPVILMEMRRLFGNKKKCLL